MDTDKSSVAQQSNTAITSGVIYAPPDIPGKYDIIPIHNSDRGNFKRCRRYWDWSSPARNNLTVRADIHGVNIPMWFGTGVHYALEQFYQPTSGIRRDPVEAFKTWFDIQWNGGVITQEWLDKVYDLNPKPIPANMAGVDAYEHSFNVETNTFHDEPVTMKWMVRGLKDILPDPDHNEYDEHRELGVRMLEWYKDYAERKDDFEILMVEHDFSVPIWDFANDCILTAIDYREQSPNCGKELEVHARGRMDAIKVRIATEKLGIMDHKTTERWGEDELRKLESDEQCSTYLWAAQIEAQYYDLPHAGQPLEEVLYNVMRKAYPREPTELSSGFFSIDRQKESTTYEILQKWIAEHLPGVPLNASRQAYLDYLRDVGDEQFVIRKNVHRSQVWLRNTGYRMYLEAMDMLDPNVRIYPNLTNDWLCLNCQFRVPCLATEDNLDVAEIIKSNYSINRDR